MKIEPKRANLIQVPHHAGDVPTGPATFLFSKEDWLNTPIEYVERRPGDRKKAWEQRVGVSIDWDFTYEGYVHVSLRCLRDGCQVHLVQSKEAPHIYHLIPACVLSRGKETKASRSTGDTVVRSGRNRSGAKRAQKSASKFAAKAEAYYMSYPPQCSCYYDSHNYVLGCDPVNGCSAVSCYLLGTAGTQSARCTACDG